MKLVNLTPHTVVLVRVSGERVELQPEGVVPRVEMEVVEVGEVEGIPIVETWAMGVTDLPEPQEGTYYIVSRAVAAACPERDDLLVPDGLVRDEQGRVVGATRLARIR